MKETIKKIYHSAATHLGTEETKVTELKNRVVLCYESIADKLKSSGDEESVKMLDLLMENSNELLLLKCEEEFVRGFSLGARITAEVYQK